jgi:hypothetical protein
MFLKPEALPGRSGFFGFELKDMKYLCRAFVETAGKISNRMGKVR